ncbi:MAG: TetR/AcrR family transcriptional regulator [Roseburia sp.]|nr:TetR/AcrR family transcriptional regulator [Roseburia sp.]MCM1097965.1 TetR/AcrR family transcriptional regulator [Ruminococcus flavefaciens]
MNSKFFDLKKEKQDRMINAALKIFALQGYRHASTDDIVREASISKGLLFHYFESKLGVYRFVYDYSVRYISLELRSNVSPAESDLFEILKQTESARMHAMRGYPYMQQFLNRCMYEDVSEALMAIEEKKGVLEEVYRGINSRIRYDLLPPGVDGEKLRKMLDFTVKGLMTERFQNASFQSEMLYREICDYLDMMKQLVYRDDGKETAGASSQPFQRPGR